MTKYFPIKKIFMNLLAREQADIHTKRDASFVLFNFPSVKVSPLMINNTVISRNKYIAAYTHTYT